MSDSVAAPARLRICSARRSRPCADRLVIAPEVVSRSGRGPAGRRAGIDAHQPRSAVPAEPRGRSRLGGRGPGDAGCRARRRSPFATGGCSSAWTTSALEALATAPQGFGAEGGTPEPRRRPRRGRLGRDDRLGNDDRRVRPPGSRVFATGGIGGVHRGALDADGWGRGVARHLVRSRGAGSDARWPSCAPARRRSSTCPRRSSTWRPVACR